MKKIILPATSLLILTGSMVSGPLYAQNFKKISSKRADPPNIRGVHW